MHSLGRTNHRQSHCDGSKNGWSLPRSGDSATRCNQAQFGTSCHVSAAPASMAITPVAESVGFGRFGSLFVWVGLGAT